MQIFNSLKAWRTARQALPQATSLGLVTTMGNLHDGHLTLISACQQENQKTAVTLFVNPTQFNQASDFENYPKTLDADIEKLEDLGVDYCLIPEQSEIYADQYHYQVHETQLSQTMEGKHRPGHFTGVLTVLIKLFNVVQPKRVYYGEKDYQQLLLVKGMVDAFFMDIEVCACPTIRTVNNFALSSRNGRLSAEGLKKAEQFARIFHAADSCEAATAELQKAGIQVEYIEELANRRFAAIFIENIRLIDNYALT